MKLVICWRRPSSSISKSSAFRSVTCLPSFVTTRSTWTRAVEIRTTSCGSCACKQNEKIMRQARHLTATDYHDKTQKVGELAPEPLPVPSSPTVETQAPPPSSACAPSHLSPTWFAVVISNSLATHEHALFPVKATFRGDNMLPTDG